jgi:ABC-2 type transport system ATP-binding protein
VSTAADGDPLLRLDAVRVQRGNRRVLNDLSFAVLAGEVVGLLGPNGAGKTTTLSVLATLRRPDAGRAWVAGHSTDREGAAVRRSLGYVPQGLAVYPTLTARENLRCFAGLLGRVDGIEDALAAVGLSDRAGDVVATFSGGMQRRLNLACGVVHRPRVLLLDEPTVGVDPQSRERILTAVRAQAARGTAVLYSTHYMEEAEQVCDRVVLLDAGRVVASGTPRALVEAHARGIRVEVLTREGLPPDWLVGIPDARIVEVVGERPVRTTVALDAVGLAPRLLDAVAASAATLLEFRIVRPSLQDVFLDLTGRALRD